MHNVVSILAPSFLIVSPPSLQLTRTTIKSLVSSNFGQIKPWTVELAALDRLKNLLLENYFDDLLALRGAIVALWATCLSCTQVFYFSSTNVLPNI